MKVLLIAPHVQNIYATKKQPIKRPYVQTINETREQKEERLKRNLKLAFAPVRKIFILLPHYYI